MTRMTKEGYKEYLKSKPKKKYNNTKIYMNKYTFHVVIKEIFEEHKKQISDPENYVLFDSILEASYYRDLLLLQKAGEVKYIELQPKFTLQPRFEKNGIKIDAITYTADFKVQYSNGKVEIIDVKGMVTKEFKLKWKIFEYKFPELNLKVIDKTGREIPLYKRRKRSGERNI